jgi:seryl-tRNA synthetase
MDYFADDRLPVALLLPTSGEGVYAQTALFEHVIERVSALITRCRDPDAEVLRFPPVMNRSQVATSGYLKSFPHLLGCVSCLHGEEADIRASVDAADWADRLVATDLVLTPAACYPLYPLVAERGAVPQQGLTFDVASYCFRHEATYEPGRMQAFRMREYVYIGTPQGAVEFRSRWMARAGELAEQLELPYQMVSASDPFFGKAGKLMAMNQIEESLKFEMLIPVNSADAPTACMSFNCHRDHFGATWKLRTGAGKLAHSACTAFGLDRLALSLFANHGVDLQSWPAAARHALEL